MSEVFFAPSGAKLGSGPLVNPGCCAPPEREKLVKSRQAINISPSGVKSEHKDSEALALMRLSRLPCGKALPFRLVLSF